MEGLSEVRDLVIVGAGAAGAWAAWRAGATHLDTTVLGIGERNGIASLGGLVARACQSAPETVERFALERLAGLDALVAGAVGVDVPFNACITGPTAFAHKAGLHAKAVLADPTSYESLDPARFGLEREVLLGHTLVGRHGVAARARDLGLELSGSVLTDATRRLKSLADGGTLTPDCVDAVLRSHATVTTSPVH